jgi:hypothetical protein
MFQQNKAHFLIEPDCLVIIGEDMKEGRHPAVKQRIDQPKQQKFGIPSLRETGSTQTALIATKRSNRILYPAVAASFPAARTPT